MVGITLTLFYISTKPPRVERETGITLAELTEPTVTYIDPVRGSDDAPITIVEFSDFHCEACRDMSDNIYALQQELPGQIKHVYKAMPNKGASTTAVPAAIAAFCAGEQGRFWEYHDYLFLNQGLLGEDLFITVAERLDLNLDKFEACYTDQETLPLIERTYQEGLALGITATPTVFIGSDRFVGAVSLDELEKYIRELLMEE